jgi:antitoxin YobK
VSMNDLEQAISFFENSSDGDFHGPVSDDLIARAEQALELSFPPTYRHFLARLGCGSICGEEFDGIIHGNFENSSVPDAIWATLDHRKHGGFPESLIAIGSTGDGGTYAIDCAQRNAEGESPVTEWWPQAPEARTFVAEDFGAFIWNTIREGNE